MRACFLDLDGVLNNCVCFSNGYCGIRRENVEVFNYFLEKYYDFNIVISSSWRYLILSKVMTIRGFEAMLLVTGINCHGRVVGHTKSDEEIKGRGRQIKNWIEENNVSKFIILDDMAWDFGLCGFKNNLILTDSAVGLTKRDVDKFVLV